MWPYLGAVAVLALWWFAFCHPFPEDPSALLGASGGASAVLVGFLATAKTVVLAITSTRAYRAIKSAQFHLVLFSYLFEAIFGGIVFLVVTILGFFLFTRTTPAPLWYTATWVALGSLALLLYVRITRLLFKLLKLV